MILANLWPVGTRIGRVKIYKKYRFDVLSTPYSGKMAVIQIIPVRERRDSLTHAYKSGYFNYPEA
jgi:hypothetical protein